MIFLTKVERVLREIFNTWDLGNVMSKLLVMMYYLKDQEATDEFIKEILKNCIEPGLNHSAHECKWDGSTLTLTTPEDESENNASNELESMPFFVNAVSEILGKAEKEKKKKKYSDPGRCRGHSWSC